MNGQRRNTIGGRVVLCLLGALCAWFLFLMAYMGVSARGFWGILSLALPVALAYGFSKGLEWFSGCRVWPVREGAVYVLLVLVTVLPRLMLMALIRVEPQSDYHFYYDAACKLAQTGVFPVTDYIVAVAPNTLTYIGALGGALSLMGTSVFAALLFNLMLTTGAVCFFYGLARQLAGKNMAILVAVLFALWPNHVLFSLMIASEPMALFFLLGGLYAVVLCFQQEKAPGGAAYGLMGGVLLGISGCVRSNAAAVFIAAVLYAALFMLRKEGRLWHRGLVAMAALLLGYFGMDMLWEVIARRTYGTELGLSFGWALYEGLDTVGNGAWTPENSAVLTNVMAAFPPEQVQEQMLKLALERISAYGLSDWFHLFARKGLNIWVHSDYAYGAIVAAQIPEKSVWMLPASGGWMYGFLPVLQGFLLTAFSVQGMRVVYHGWRRGVEGKLLLAVFPILAFALVHSFVTSIPRYQFMAVPLLLLSVGMMAGQLKDYAGNARPHAGLMNKGKGFPR